MNDTSRPDCHSCQARATAIREQRDPYTFADLISDTLALIDHAERQAAELVVEGRAG